MGWQSIASLAGKLPHSGIFTKLDPGLLTASFQPSFSLPDNIDAAGVKAVFKDGMLNVTMPKTAAAKPKSIDIKVE